jgi:excisionase family DNA binding protein
MKQPTMVLMTEAQLAQLMESVVEKTVASMTKNAYKLNDDCLLSVAETCNFMGVTRCTLSKWTDEGIIPRIKKGGRVFYKKSDLLGANKQHIEA